jgi:hypothetical protein
MSAQTGRTVNKFVRFIVDDSGGTIREIGINSLSVVGLVYDQQDLTAYQDAVKGALPNHPDAPIEISGPWDNSVVAAVAASAAAPVLSGCHAATMLPAINGAYTPLTLDVRFGVRHYWETGEPQFGITSGAVDGYLCVSYVVDTSNMIYTAKFVLNPGSIAPAWGTAAET